MWRRSFFTQIFIGIFATVLLGLGAAAVVTESTLRERLTDWLTHEVLVQARALTVTLDTHDVQTVATRVGKETEQRITILALDGRVLAESTLPTHAVHLIENHAGRPEVQAALQDGWGSHQRISSTTGGEYLYVAVRDDSNNRITRVAVPLSDLEENIAFVRAGVLASLLFGIFVAAIMALLIARRLSGSVRAIARVANERAAGQRTPFPEGETEEFIGLARTLEGMAQQLDSRLDQLEGERARLRTILDTMVEGVILCSPDGDILLSNQSFLEMFGWSRSPHGKRLVEITRVPEVVELSQRILREREPDTVEFELGRKTIQATFVPLPAKGMSGYLAVFHDITELRRADQVRRDFVANVSHELRTPLASITGYAESLLEGAMSDPEVAQSFLGGITRNADRLSRLIEDLLDLARIESGRYVLHPEWVDVGDAVDHGVSLVEKVNSRQHPFHNDVPAGLTVWADPKALSQILVNLIENAAKYTPPGTEIRTTAETTYDSVTIRIRDLGPGIPPQDLSRIFERFYRGDKSRNAAGEPGTGLGLAICKHLATEMGGSIHAESSGRGTTISIRLPCLASTDG